MGLDVEAVLSGECLAELTGEAMNPVLQVEQLRFGLASARQLQHVLDDQVHASGVILDDLGQSQIRRIQHLGVDRVGEETNDGINAGDPFQQFVARNRAAAEEQIDIGGRFELRND